MSALEGLADKPARPRLLIEEWLPAAAIGVECIRERSTGQQPPDKRLHIWWARRPLTASRAAVLGSLLPADFPRDVFERLLGFARPGTELVEIRRLMDLGVDVPGGFGGGRAFSRGMPDRDLKKAHEAARGMWGDDISVIDPMAGGGSIPLESARLGFRTLANEYNPVACSVLEATVDYPFRFGPELADRTRFWGHEWLRRIERRVAAYYPKRPDGLVHAYIYVRTVPCPDTAHETPLMPDWHLLKPTGGREFVAEPVVDKRAGTWTVRIRELGGARGQLSATPTPTYSHGKGVSLFTGHQIPADYIKAKAQAGEMGSRLYSIAVKSPRGLEFALPSEEDVDAIARATRALARQMAQWEQQGVIPTEDLSPISNYDRGHRLYGIHSWAKMFLPRQLLATGVLVDELRNLRREIEESEGASRAAVVVHHLAFAIDKLVDYNCSLNTWESTRGIVKHIFQKHNFSFKPAFAEMAVCGAGAGLAWAIDNVVDAWSGVAVLPRASGAKPVSISLGSATSMPFLHDRSITSVVVDPPYDDNVQYAELADFFYVWLKRTLGHRHPNWFASALCDRDQEAVVNPALARAAEAAVGPRSKALSRTYLQSGARARYGRLMAEAFAEAFRILRDDGVLTVMFTHKKQEAWQALFTSLIRAGFTITATWPVKTESEHSLHQAKQNAAQSTVILVARKREVGAGVGFFDRAMKKEVRDRARASAERLRAEGLNAVDQLVGSFGPALEVFSRFDEVRTDTGEPVGVDRAIDEAADAVSAWRIEQLAARGLEGVEAEGRFALLCWDVLGAAEFRFNEARLLGNAVGMDVDTLVAAGLVAKEGDKVRILSARQRRRDRALEPEEKVETLFGVERQGRRRRRADVLKVHPNDPTFRTALDGCHALALRYLEAGAGAGGIGAARALARQQLWRTDAPVARLMAALVTAAPEAVRREQGKTSAAALFPEFRAWHALLEPLFAIVPPDWTEHSPAQMQFELSEALDNEPADEPNEDQEEDEEDEA